MYTSAIINSAQRIYSTHSTRKNQMTFDIVTLSIAIELVSAKQQV